MKTLIAYYSRSGVTKAAVSRMADEIGDCDVLPIETVENMNGILGFIKGGYQSSQGKSVKIKPINTNLTQYDLIVIASPVWAGHVSSPVYTFIKENCENINKCAYLITRASPNSQFHNIFDELDKLIGKTRIAAESIHSKAIDFDLRVSKFAKGIASE